MKSIRLHEGKERSLLRRHPWVFERSIARGRADAGETVRVEAADGRFLAWAAYSPQSAIRLRAWSYDEAERIDAGLFERRIALALALRARLPIASDAMRLVHGESDGLPGLVVDRYGDTLVAQFLAAGVERWKGAIADALLQATGLAKLYERSDAGVRELEGLPPATGWLRGDGATAIGIREHDWRFALDIAEGHKTGFYLDQRDNRRLVESFARDRRVLDLFSHSGAFSLYALRGRARTVTAVESAGRLHGLGRRLVIENHLDPGRTEFVTADVFEDLRRRAERKESYDLVVCDPPPLAKRRTHIDKAARAYKDLNRLALGRLAPGGLLLTFSCSGAIDSKLFRQILFAAAVEARVDLALLAPLAAAVDHPVSVFHPQGEYLKGWLGVVRGPLG